MSTTTQTAAVVLVTNSAGDILLIQEAKPQYSGLWFIPGGRCQEQETLVQTALREVREEAGVEIELEGVLPLDDDNPALATTYRNRLRFAFKARYKGGTLKQQPDEHSLQARWFTPAEVATLPLRSDLVRQIVAMAAGPFMEMESFFLGRDFLMSRTKPSNKTE
jgi:phosphatase NudJ